MDGKRRVWSLIFGPSGVIAILAVLMVAIGIPAALPFAVISWLVTIYAGYRIWKADHPAASVWRELSRRTVAVITFGAGFVALLLALAFPQVVLVIVGVWIVVVLALFILLALPGRR